MCPAREPAPPVDQPAHRLRDGGRGPALRGVRRPPSGPRGRCTRGVAPDTRGRVSRGPRGRPDEAAGRLRAAADYERRSGRLRSQMPSARDRAATPARVRRPCRRARCGPAGRRLSGVDCRRDRLRSSHVPAGGSADGAASGIRADRAGRTLDAPVDCEPPARAARVRDWRGILRRHGTGRGDRLRAHATQRRELPPSRCPFIRPPAGSQGRGAGEDGSDGDYSDDRNGVRRSAARSLARRFVRCRTAGGRPPRPVPRRSSARTWPIQCAAPR